MIPTQQQVDVWLATVNTDLGRLQAGLLDLIDVGADEQPTRIVASRQDTGRTPSRRQQAATDRTPGADGMFAPTPKTQSRRSGRSDPTGKAVLAWEAKVQAEVTAVFGVLSGQVETLSALGLTVTDGSGRRLIPPDEPATEVTKSGHRRIVLPPHRCRRHVMDVVTWLGAAADQLADRMYACTDPDVGDHLDDRATELRRTLGGMARRIAPDRPVQPTLVYCPCGELARYRKLERCERCRRAELRAEARQEGAA